ncbi:L,D-transpeptidase family protein [Sphingopyxis sp. YF1]|jgi:murein L,D-transpeptidase YcbB/YkuD|uniref:L,D-transpeptidase family protein n=1 Tax=Sphingopyxis sp. YF1 TaxID=2482763 RepID=UPI001F619ACD|nr:L,D-transpeptidase family protein [Sphingopyxis sp. YF1]
MLAICAIAALPLTVASAHAAPKKASKTVTKAAPAPASPALVAAIRAEAGGDLKSFYGERGYRPLWVRAGKIGPDAQSLLGWLDSAELDGLKSSSYRPDRLRALISAARSGSPEAVARAELALSDAFARYVRDMRTPGKAKMIYADRSLKPKRLAAAAVLRAAAFPQDFGAYLTGMGWMSEHYLRLRNLAAHAGKAGASKQDLARLRLNLDRARILPGPYVYHIVVDASSGQLWYYGAGKRAGSMKVVVGAPETQTPMLAGRLQWAILNPYWNVPDYLAQKSIAPKVLAGRSLASLRMEALSDWGSNPQKLDPATIDWQAVAAGDRALRLRELPGGANSMGKVKFLFPNKEGIYLHDTPERALLAKPDRHFSNGCIRLEDAAELGRWLMQRPIATRSKTPEQAVPLPAQVPVYLTYITAVATKRGIAFRDDVYGRDG